MGGGVVTANQVQLSGEPGVVEVEELTPEQGRELFEWTARERIGMSGEECLVAWRLGALPRITVRESSQGRAKSLVGLLSWGLGRARAVWWSESVLSPRSPARRPVPASSSSPSPVLHAVAGAELPAQRLSTTESITLLQALSSVPDPRK